MRRRANTITYTPSPKNSAWISIGENRKLRGGAYGNAVLSRVPIVADKNHDLTCRRYEPRGCLEVTIKPPDSETALHLFNVHLGTGFFERRYQAHRLFDVIAGNESLSSPRVILDFNEWTRGLTTRLMCYHFNSAEPEQRLGRARVSGSVSAAAPGPHLLQLVSKLEQISVHRSQLALAASDHLPIVAGFIRLIGAFRSRTTSTEQ